MEDDFLLYLYNLALITIVFVGFAALYLGFKQQMAGKMTKLDVMLTENHFLLSFMVVGAALLPPLLALFPEQLSWETALRMASFYAALQLFLFCITFPRRRSRASDGELMPIGTKVLVAFYYLVVFLMLISLIVDKPALYAFVLTGQQLINVVTFKYALGRHVLHVPAGSATVRRRVHHFGQPDK